MTKTAKPVDNAYTRAIRAAERRIYRDAIEGAGGDKREAASLLGISLHRLTARSRLLGGVFAGEAVRGVLDPPPPRQPKPKISTVVKLAPEGASAALPVISPLHAPHVQEAIRGYHEAVAGDEDEDEGSDADDELGDDGNDADDELDDEGGADDEAVS